MDAVSEFEKRYIRRVLDAYRWNRSQSANALGIHRNTLRSKMLDYHLVAKTGAGRNGTAWNNSKKK
jgi:DNA-binding NtrC family response regulator